MTDTCINDNSPSPSSPTCQSIAGNTPAELFGKEPFLSMDDGHLNKSSSHTTAINPSSINVPSLLSQPSSSRSTASTSSCKSETYKALQSFLSAKQRHSSSHNTLRGSASTPSLSSAMRTRGQRLRALMNAPNKPTQKRVFRIPAPRIPGDDDLAHPRIRGEHQALDAHLELDDRDQVLKKVHFGRCAHLFASDQERDRCRQWISPTTRAGAGRRQQQGNKPLYGFYRGSPASVISPSISASKTQIPVKRPCSAEATLFMRFGRERAAATEAFRARAAAEGHENVLSRKHHRSDVHVEWLEVEAAPASALPLNRRRAIAATPGAQAIGNQHYHRTTGCTLPLLALMGLERDSDDAAAMVAEEAQTGGMHRGPSATSLLLEPWMQVFEADFEVFSSRLSAVSIRLAEVQHATASLPRPNTVSASLSFDLVTRAISALPVSAASKDVCTCLLANIGSSIFSGVHDDQDGRPLPYFQLVQRLVQQHRLRQRQARRVRSKALARQAKRERRAQAWSRRMTAVLQQKASTMENLFVCEIWRRMKVSGSRARRWSCVVRKRTQWIQSTLLRKVVQAWRDQASKQKLQRVRDWLEQVKSAIGHAKRNRDIEKQNLPLYEQGMQRAQETQETVEQAVQTKKEELQKVSEAVQEQTQRDAMLNEVLESIADVWRVSKAELDEHYSTTSVIGGDAEGDNAAVVRYHEAGEYDLIRGSVRALMGKEADNDTAVHARICSLLDELVQAQTLLRSPSSSALTAVDDGVAHVDRDVWSFLRSCTSIERAHTAFAWLTLVFPSPEIPIPARSIIRGSGNSAHEQADDLAKVIDAIRADAEADERRAEAIEKRRAREEVSIIRVLNEAAKLVKQRRDTLRNSVRDEIGSLIDTLLLKTKEHEHDQWIDALKRGVFDRVASSSSLSSASLSPTASNQPCISRTTFVELMIGSFSSTSSSYSKTASYHRFSSGLLEALWPSSSASSIGFAEFTSLILRIAKLKSSGSSAANTRRLSTFIKRISSSSRTSSVPLTSIQKFRCQCMHISVQAVFQTHHRFLFEVFVAFSGARELSFVGDIELDMGFDGFEAIVAAMPDSFKKSFTRLDLEVMFEGASKPVSKRRKRGVSRTTSKRASIGYHEFCEMIAAMASMIPVKPFNTELCDRLDTFIEDALIESKPIIERTQKKGVRELVERCLHIRNKEIQAFVTARGRRRSSSNGSKK